MINGMTTDEINSIINFTESMDKIKTEELFTASLDAAKTNRKGLVRLKNAIVTLGQFELAVKLREIEQEAFPETKEVKTAKHLAFKLTLAFRMVDLNISKESCWLIAETLKVYNEKNGEFSIDDATKIRLKKDEIFYSEDE